MTEVEKGFGKDSVKFMMDSARCVPHFGLIAELNCCEVLK